MSVAAKQLSDGGWLIRLNGEWFAGADRDWCRANLDAGEVRLSPVSDAVQTAKLRRVWVQFASKSKWSAEIREAIETYVPEKEEVESAE